MLDLPETTPAFEFGCSPLPFDAMDYWILTHQGSHLEALLRGATIPRSGNEHYFIRCIREDADYDSHQCLEADAWRKWVERRAFEARHPSPSPNRTWIRTHELRNGMILLRTEGPLLLETISGHRVRGGWVEYRNATDLPWRRFCGDGWWRAVTNLATRVRSEVYIPDGELLEAAAGLDRVMTYIWRDHPDSDMLVLDPDTDQTYFIPSNRVSGDAYQPGKLHPDQPIRVQWWEGEPVWVWGPK
jgi:hypothetical protein